MVSAPPPSPPLLPLPSSSSSSFHPPSPSLVRASPLPSCYHHSSPLCAPAAPPAPAAAAAAATPLAIGLEYQGCLHRATGLHHCLRRSANHQPASQPLPLALSLHPSPPRPSLLSSSFASRLPGADFVENMNIITLPADSPIHLHAGTYARG